MASRKLLQHGKLLKAEHACMHAGRNFIIFLIPRSATIPFLWKRGSHGLHHAWSAWRGRATPDYTVALDAPRPSELYLVLKKWVWHINIAFPEIGYNYAKKGHPIEVHLQCERVVAIPSALKS
jgi:hypothetical protein